MGRSFVCIYYILASYTRPSRDTRLPSGVPSIVEAPACKRAGNSPATDRRTSKQAGRGDAIPLRACENVMLDPEVFGISATVTGTWRHIFRTCRTESHLILRSTTGGSLNEGLARVCASYSLLSLFSLFSVPSTVTNVAARCVKMSAPCTTYLGNRSHTSPYFISHSSQSARAR